MVEFIGSAVILVGIGYAAWLLFDYLKKILEALLRVEAILKPMGVASGVEFYTNINGQNQKVTSMLLKVNQNLPVSVKFKDKFGNDAAVDGVPVWAVTDVALADLEVAADGLSAVLKPKGAVGTLKVQVTADADLGEGVKSILGELEVQLLPGEAVTVELTPGEPTDQTVA